jgi:hypothetical protein
MTGALRDGGDAAHERSADTEDVQMHQKTARGGSASARS